MKKYNEKEINEFLKESNAIEGVYDDDSFKQAQIAWDYLIKQKKLTVKNILETHRLLMINQNLNPDEKGFFRRSSVWIGGREGCEWIYIPDLIKEWILNINDIELPRESKERYSKQLHVDYEKIHPFIDGNGRTGRMFMNWWRIRNNLPILVIHEGGEQIEYYKWFK